MAVNRWLGRVPDVLASPGLTGLAFGALGVLLVTLGNPANTGVCASCFLENVAGAIGLHADRRMAYLRPELIGIVLGAFVAARASGEFRGGSAGGAGARFVGGALMIVGSSVFLGCPLKVIYRLGAGDWTALTGLAGLVVGVALAVRYLRAGFEFERRGPAGTEAATVVVAITVLLAILLALRPSFMVFGDRGPAAQHAPWLISLAVGLGLGVLGQRSRFCTTGAVRDALITRRVSALSGPVAMLVGVTVMALVTSRFHAGWSGQPSSHPGHLWSFAGMALVGFVAVGIGGCPYRQLVLAGQGDAGAATAMVGMLFGSALVRNWSIASTVEGPTAAGPVAVLLGAAVVLLYAGRRVAAPSRLVLPGGALT